MFFLAAGQIISTQVGLGMASLFDARMGSITALSQFYLFTALLMFLLLNGHLILIKMVLDSFTALPLNHTFSINQLITDIINYSAIIFSASLLLSIAIIIAILTANTTLAVMSRFAPQFSLFSVGVNITLIFGLICVYLTFGYYVDKGSVLLTNALEFVQQLIWKMKIHG